MNSSLYLTDLSTGEYDYDVPNRDNCDRCGRNAWESGMPAWTCDRQLFCAACNEHLANTCNYRKGTSE